MARIIGKIESLKSLKSELKDKVVSRFKSVKEISDFLSNYELEKQTILNDTAETLKNEYFETGIMLQNRIQTKADFVKLETEKIDNRKTELQAKIDSFEINKDHSYFKKFVFDIAIFFTKKRSRLFVSNKTRLLNASLKDISIKIKIAERFIKDYETNKQHLIAKRAQSKIEKLEYTRTVIENSKNLISGAIGENLVVKEIEKLSDDYVLINDFNLSFSTPIFYKKHNEQNLFYPN